VFRIKWAEFAEYCYTHGKAKWNFDGWLGEILFKEASGWRKRFEAVQKTLAQHNPYETVLDLMCGGAYPSRKIARQAKQVIAVDIDREALSFAKKKIREEQLENVELIRCDVCHLPLKEKSVDVSLNIGGIEWFGDSQMEKMLKEAEKATRKAIIVTFTSPAFKNKLHYKLRLVHLRMLLAKATMPRIRRKEEVEKILKRLFPATTMTEVGYFIIAKSTKP
jgi:ubiquinone/menaquinone biosynthesis C-methylase UbiE